MSKKTYIDFVLSGTKMLRVHGSKKHNDPEYIKMRRDILVESANHMLNVINDASEYCEIGLSVLYNAYTESSVGKILNDDKLFFNNIYADSGGLQVVTRGLTLDDTMKKTLYESQNYAGVSFCYDEIPLENIDDDIVLATNNRINIETKVFNSSRFKECAIKTAENVKEQLSIIDSEVMYIVQGNTYKDMIQWFDIAYDVLGEENIKKLHGIAVADSCMGVRELESCDMMIAAKAIFDKYPSLKRNLHLLGIGAASRITPFIIGKKYGILQNDVVLSLDSTSQSMMYMHGEPVYFDKKLNLLQSFRLFCEEMKPIYEKYIDNYDSNDLAKFIFDNSRSFSAVENICYDKNHKYHKIGFTVCPLYCIWSSKMVLCDVDKYVNTHHYLTTMCEIKSVNDYEIWRNKNFHKLKSYRIKKKRNKLF